MQYETNKQTAWGIPLVSLSIVIYIAYRVIQYHMIPDSMTATTELYYYLPDIAISLILIAFFIVKTISTSITPHNWGIILDKRSGITGMILTMAIGYFAYLHYSQVYESNIMIALIHVITVFNTEILLRVILFDYLVKLIGKRQHGLLISFVLCGIILAVAYDYGNLSSLRYVISVIGIQSLFCYLYYHLGSIILPLFFMTLLRSTESQAFPEAVIVLVLYFTLAVIGSKLKKGRRHVFPLRDCDTF